MAQGGTFGSSANAVALGGGSLISYKHLKTNPEAAQELLIDGLAWYKIAMVRGDSVAEMLLKSDIKRYGIDLFTVPQEEVDRKAAELYHALSKEREELGLGTYDNNVPEHLETFFYYMSGKWAKEYRQ
ncbi:hypothetical protein [Teredinibacter purpureus]|uniref:hypothetical protein n=1 Tax=Teredinibacter purpureus TaxID=2731756 RepID=UPI0005F77C6E|nr:hypothetical protein [Teredinibacter purpureus]